MGMGQIFNGCRQGRLTTTSVSRPSAKLQWIHGEPSHLRASFARQLALPRNLCHAHGSTLHKHAGLVPRVGAPPQPQLSFWLLCGFLAMCRCLRKQVVSGLSHFLAFLFVLQAELALRKSCVCGHLILDPEPPQVSALERGPPDGREGAAWTASSLAADPANIGAFVQADAVPRLLQMLKTGAPPCDTGRRHSCLQTSRAALQSLTLVQYQRLSACCCCCCCCCAAGMSLSALASLQACDSTVCKQSQSRMVLNPHGCQPMKLSRVSHAGKTLGRDSALHVLACVARGGGGDSVAMIGGAGLEVPR